MEIPQARIKRGMSLTTVQTIALELYAKFGEEAPHVASKRADSCQRIGDLDGFKYWNKVCAMIVRIVSDNVRLIH